MMKMDYDKLVKEYLAECVISGGMRQQNTYIEKYRLKKFREYLEETGINFLEIKLQDAQDYQGWLLAGFTNEGNQYSRGTIRNFLKAVIRLFDFFKRKKLVNGNLFKDISRVKEQKKLPDNILGEKDMQELLIELSGYWKTEEEIREVVRRYKVHVICEIMYSTAMRIGEVAGLEKEDIDFRKKGIHLKASKGGKSRLVFLNDYTYEILKIYVREIYPLLKALYYQGSKKLFCADNRRLVVIVNQELEKVSSKLRCGKVTCHSFRHAVGYHLLRAGCDIRYIQYLLGHKRIKNTEVYTKVGKDDLRAKVDQYHPRQYRRKKDEHVK